MSMMEQKIPPVFETNSLPYPWAEQLFRALVFYTIGTYIAEEVFVGTEHSKEGWPGLLWSERIVAMLFTIEYGMRWYFSGKRWRYPCSLMAIVDLVAIMPFYVGFFVPEQSLHLIRTLRILRLLKLYRYSAGLQMLALGFARVRTQLRSLGFAMLILIFVSQAAMYECERYDQPEKFGSLDDAFWFTCVTVTTVGYGDLYPVTGAGRAVAMLTFVSAVTLFGTFTAVMSSAFTVVFRQYQGTDKTADENDD